MTFTYGILHFIDKSLSSIFKALNYNITIKCTYFTQIFNHFLLFLLFACNLCDALHIIIVHIEKKDTRI